MKPKMIDYPLYRDRRPQEIKQLLIDVASGNMPESQKDIVGDMLAESKLMIEAADYIRQLEILNDLLVPLAQCGRKALNDHLVSGMVAYFENNHKDLSPEFVKIVEENFWELLE